jgi:hypothetical protein
MNKKKIAVELLKIAKKMTAITGLSEDGGELFMYIDNSGQLYRNRLIPIYKNLMLKKKKDVYDSNMAVKLFQYLTDEGGKMYFKEFSSSTGGPTNFPTSVRKEVAIYMRDKFERESKSGELDWVLKK